MRLPLPALLVVVLALVACTAAPSPTATAAAAATAAPSPTPAGADPDTAVVTIEQTGGMMPPWETLRWYPSVALYADGRLISQGPQMEIYPGPALPNLLVTHFSRGAVEQVLQWAAEAGLQGEDRQLGEPMLDSGVTLFTIVRPDGRHQTSVTNLGESSPEVAAAAQFMELMQNLRQWLPDGIASDETPYEWQALRVVSFVADLATLPDPALASERDWPLAGLATLGESLSEPAIYRCFVVDGDDAAVLRPLVEEANELTIWNSGGEKYQLYLHPQLPDDEDCPGF